MAMDYGYGSYGEEASWKWKANIWGKNRVLLREPEKCAQCSGVYISLYPLKSCVDHSGLEKL